MSSATTPSLRIGLLDNSCHSLQRGYELWNKGQQTQDVWTLKESIIWIHHGVELALKQLLVQTNEYLVFEKVDEAVRKLAHLRRQPGMSSADVLNLFDRDDTVISVGFRRLIQRTAVMLDITGLAEGAPLRTYVDELTRYRNKLVHFSVELNIAEITSLLSDLLEPLLELLEREVDDVDFVQNCIPEIRRRAQPVRRLDRTLGVESEQRIARLLQLFSGQQVPGELLGREGDIVLPVFSRVEEAGPTSRVDIEAEGADENWIVEVKLRLMPRLSEIVEQLERARSSYREAKVWLVIMSEISPKKKLELAQKGYLVSGLPEIVRLEQVLLSGRG
jgi:hypothetical protein